MNKMNNFENIKSMDYKELAVFLADWAESKNWNNVHEWLARECRPEDRATHKVITDLVHEIHRLIPIHNRNYFVGKVVAVTDPENWNGYKNILVTVGHMCDSDNDNEVVLCVRELMDKPIATGIVETAYIYTQFRLELSVCPYPFIKDNWDWAKKLFDEIPDKVSYEWFVLHGYMPTC